MEKSTSTKDTNPDEVEDLSPNNLFKRMVDSDKKQNLRISSKLSGGSGESSPKNITKMRFFICTLGLLSLSLSQMSRMVMNVTITSMVKHRGEKQAVSDDGSCPWPDDFELPMTPAIETYPTTQFETHPSTTTESIFEKSTVAYATVTTARSITSARPWTTTTTTHYPQPTVEQSFYTTGIELEQTPYTWSTDSENSFSTVYLVTGQPSEEDPTKHPVDFKSSARSPVWEPTSTTNILVDYTDGDSYASLNDTTIEPLGALVDKFDWSIKQQSTLLGGFYYSYFVFMILGGRMAEVYGAKYVLMLSVAGSALINLATPWMARTNFALLVFSRVVLGAIQSGVFPGMYALFAKWLTMSEASIYAPLIKVNLRLGMMMGTMIPGMLKHWPNVFYFSGAVCAAWSVIWFIVAQSDPQESSLVSAAELAHILKKKKKKPVEEPKNEDVEMTAYKGGEKDDAPRKPKKSLKTPWVKIITAPSVIGLIIVKTTFNYALDFMAILLPTYLGNVFHLPTKKISSITTPLYTMQVVLVVFVGWLAKHMVKTKPCGLSKTGVRKSFQALASYGIGLAYILSTFNDCNLTYLAIAFYIASFLSMFTAGGETMLPYDLSDEYPATIMAIANSVANMSGITITALTSFILGEQGGSFSRWSALLYLIGGANILGGLAFSLLVKAEPIDFSGSKRQASNHNANAESGGLQDVIVVKPASSFESADNKVAKQNDNASLSAPEQQDTKTQDASDKLEATATVAVAVAVAVEVPPTNTNDGNKEGNEQ